MIPGCVVLTEFMDARYGAGNWTPRTAVGVGTDIGPALADALDYLRANFGRGVVAIPPGLWRMVNAPSAAQWSGNYCEGLGSQASIIVYDNDSGSPFAFSGAGGYTGGGIRGLGILLEDGHPTSTAQIIRLQGDSTYQPDQMEFRDIYASAIGSSYWYDGFYAYGNARVAPQGIRVADLRNIQIFRCRNTGAYLSNIVQWTIDNVGIYAGQGTGNNFYIAGGGTPSTNSIQVYVRGLSCANELNLTNCSKWTVTGSVHHVACDPTANYGDLFVIKSSAQLGVFGANTRIASY